MSHTVLLINPNTSRPTTDMMVALAQACFQSLQRNDIQVRGLTAPEGPGMLTEMKELEQAATMARHPLVLAQAQDAFQRSLQLVRRGNDLGPRSSVLCDLAQVRLALGQADGAELLALECQQLALADSPLQAARADLLLARVAMGRMNSEAALSLLASAEQRLLAAGIAAGSEEHLPVALARTQVLIDVGNVPGADAALTALRNLPRARPTPTDAWDWRIGALQARLYCRQGRSGDGRELRQLMLAEAGVGQPERQRLADEIAEWAAGCGRG